MARDCRTRLSPCEILCVLTALVVVAWTALTIGLLAVEKARVAGTARLLRDIAAATLTFKADTGRFPTHFADYDPDFYPDVKNLTVPPTVESGITTWQGPYLKAGFRRNAWGGLMHVHHSTHQFDLDGDGVPDTAGTNSYVVLAGVPAAAAVRLDAMIDGASNPRAGRLTIADSGGGGVTVYYLIAD